MEPWIGWAAAEGGVKALGRIFAKETGLLSHSILGALAVTLVIGAVQVITGFIGALATDRSLSVSRRGLFSTFLFGIGASLSATIGVWAFTFPGADAGIYTFFVILAIIPSIVIDTRYFQDAPLLGRQWVGILTFLVAGWVMLGYPNLSALASLPIWVGLAIVNGLTNLSNETVARVEKNIPPFRFNFWVGVVTVGATGLSLLFLNSGSVLFQLPSSFWVFAALNGLAVVVMVLARIMAYRAGGSIALKKFVMHAVQLTGVAGLGILFFHEAATSEKLIGIIGFLVAFPLADKAIGEVFSRYVRQTTHRASK